MSALKSAFLYIAIIIFTGAAPLPEAPSVISENILSGAHFSGQNYYTVKQTPAPNGTDTALEIQLIRMPELPYHTQIIIPVTSDIRKDDILFVSFRMRSAGNSDETGEAAAECVFQRNKDPWEAVASGKVFAGKEWKDIYLPLIAKTTTKAGESQLCIRFGFKLQTLQIASLKVVNFGNTIEIRQLPVMSSSYEGRDEKAAWRKAALARIEKIRTAPVTVKVISKNKPVEGAEVSIRQIRNSFAFGTAISGQYINGRYANTPDGERYRKEITALFNQAVDEGELKWPQWESSRETAAKIAEWCLANGISMRGHNLVWERWDRLPKDIEELSKDKDALSKRILEHIREETVFFKGKLPDWDVVNEPIPNTTLRDILGKTAMTEWYREAKKNDPAAVLYVNEYSIEGTDDVKLAKFCALLDEMKKENVPFDGIGSQCHIGMNPPPVNKFLESLDALGRYTDNIKITEYDCNAVDEELAADFTRDILIAAYSHPKVKGFLMWGFWDGMHWKKNAPVYRKDWSLKPSGQIWKDYVLGKWKTSADGRTSHNGTFTAKAHLGEYEISVKYKNSSVKKNVLLERRGTTAEIIIP